MQQIMQATPSDNNAYGTHMPALPLIPPAGLTQLTPLNAFPSAMRQQHEKKKQQQHQPGNSPMTVPDGNSGNQPVQVGMIYARLFHH